MTRIYLRNKQLKYVRYLNNLINNEDFQKKLREYKSNKRRKKFLYKNPINIVIARYQKDVSFVNKINNNKNTNIMIYDKENSENPYNIPVNKGNEASVYLKYIIDHYDTLTDFTYFIHDEEEAWHHSGSVVDKFMDAIESKKKYFNINDKQNSI